MDKKYEIDMCNGPIFTKLLVFALPLMLSSMLQLLFNAADIVVVGRFVGHEALAAVGSTTSLINLLLNIFMGFSVGVNVMTARYKGLNSDRDISEVVHTSITFSLLCGIALIFIGVTLARPMLTLMGTPDDVLDGATLYMQIYFSGMPVIMLYNFSSSIFRAIGDTKRPLYYLVAAGILNVIMNLFFVTKLHMGVEGVALATVLSQVLSASLMIRALMKSEGAYRLDIKKLGISKRMLGRIVKIGIPAGVQGALFSISNVLIQSSINLFGSVAMAGSTSAANIEGFVYMAMNAFHQTALSFTGQNYGAGKIERIKKVLIMCILCVTGTGLIMGIGACIFGEQLLSIYSSEADVIGYGMTRLYMICLPYFMCGIMDVMTGAIRGLGYSAIPMAVSVVGVCGLRILWISTVFQWHKSLEILYLSYIITWTLTSLCHLVTFIIIYKKLKREKNLQEVRQKQ